jgi:hypothetical protein
MPVPSRPSSRRLLAAGCAVAQGLLLAVLPQGGQHGARRNAWAGMARDAQLSRARRDAGRAMDLAVAAAGHAQACSSVR